MNEALKNIKESNNKIRMPKKKKIDIIESVAEKVVQVKDSEEDTESLFNDSSNNDDSDFCSMFERLSDYDDESFDSDYKWSVAIIKVRVRRKSIFFL